MKYIFFLNRLIRGIFMSHKVIKINLQFNATLVVIEKQIYNFLISYFIN
jgi:hypothetical protein